ncbi:hypothetical protein [Acinetobacter rathckeae]|uniref:hypothetical protein n=1 Tax=Acinetobacter rathckeae TaxID=2605272 RepID=UPI0018A32017|nr:hypothetical protein [Acinetobacter rathckeae]MBF7686861.1 hypothetical protein [Acinetobacter rathckeae]MBF7694735.1 hypothetical protein [Acinetobacter rathckeae]
MKNKELSQLLQQVSHAPWVRHGRAYQRLALIKLNEKAGTFKQNFPENMKIHLPSIGVFDGEFEELQQKQKESLHEKRVHVQQFVRSQCNRFFH